jgi:hypothetical protein
MGWGGTGSLSSLSAQLVLEELDDILEAGLVVTVGFDQMPVGFEHGGGDLRFGGGSRGGEGLEGGEGRRGGFFEAEDAVQSEGDEEFDVAGVDVDEAGGHAACGFLHAGEAGEDPHEGAVHVGAFLKVDGEDIDPKIRDRLGIRFHEGGVLERAFAHDFDHALRTVLGYENGGRNHVFTIKKPATESMARHKLLKWRILRS